MGTLVGARGMRVLGGGAGRSARPTPWSARGAPGALPPSARAGFVLPAVADPPSTWYDRQMNLRVPTIAERFAERLITAGHSAYLVGGAVRDLVMRRTVSDFDIATNATPQEVQKLYRRVIPTGIKHGTVTVLFDGVSFEVTTFRTEQGYSDRRHPDEVRYAATIDEDIARRDFTCNGLAIDLSTRRLVDLVDGVADIRRAIIRAIGTPEDRMREDGLRIIRAVRFSVQLEFSIHPDTQKAMRSEAAALSGVATERVRDELQKIMASRQPSAAFRTMHQIRVLSRYLPELAATVDHPNYRRPGPPTLFDHLLAACDAAPREDIDLRWAALLHDIGKPQTFAEDADRGVSYIGHDALSADLAEARLSELRFPNTTIHAVGHLIRHHMYGYDPTWSDAAVRRFVARVGREWVHRVTALRAADAAGYHTSPADRGWEPRDVGELEERVRRLDAASHATTVKDLAVGGNDLAEAGIPRGPQMGTVLRFLLEAVLDDPAQNTRETLLHIAREFYRRHIVPLQDGRE